MSKEDKPLVNFRTGETTGVDKSTEVPTRFILDPFFQQLDPIEQSFAHARGDGRGRIPIFFVIQYGFHSRHGRGRLNEYRIFQVAPDELTALAERL